MTSMLPFLSLRTDKGEIVELLFPAQVTIYNVTTLARLQSSELRLSRADFNGPYAYFSEPSVLTVPLEWTTDAAKAEMVKKTFFVDAVGTPKPFPDDPSKRTVAIGQADAAKARLIKEIRAKLPELAAELTTTGSITSVPVTRLRVDNTASSPPSPPPAPAPLSAAATASPVAATAAFTQPKSAPPSPPPQQAAAATVGNEAAAATVVCATCGGHIPTTSFTLHSLKCQSSKARCPECGESVERTDLEVHRTYNHVLAPCPNKGCTQHLSQAQLRAHLLQCGHQVVACPDCSEKMPSKDLEEHRVQRCSAGLVPCTHRGCKEAVPRRKFEAHKEACRYRVVGCRFCDAQLVQVEMRQHETSCGSITEMCPSCRNRVPRASLLAHEATCGRGPVLVPCANPGCPEKVSRADLERHQLYCDYLRQACKAGCKLVIAKREIDEHTRVCPKTKIKCAHDRCPEYVERDVWERHRDSCLYQKLPCEFCGASVERKDMKGHANTCGGELTTCTRCNKTFSRSTLKLHSTRCTHSDPMPPPSRPPAEPAAPVSRMQQLRAAQSSASAAPAAPQPAARHNAVPALGARTSAPSALPPVSATRQHQQQQQQRTPTGLQRNTSSSEWSRGAAASKAAVPSAGGRGGLARTPAGTAPQSTAPLATRPAGPAATAARVGPSSSAAPARQQPQQQRTPSIDDRDLALALQLEEERLREQADADYARQLAAEAEGGRGGRGDGGHTDGGDRGYDEYADDGWGAGGGAYGHGGGGGQRAMTMVDRPNTDEDARLARELYEQERREAQARDEAYAQRLQQQTVGGGGDAYRYAGRGSGSGGLGGRSDDWDDTGRPLPTTTAGAGRGDPRRGGASSSRFATGHSTSDPSRGDFAAAFQSAPSAPQHAARGGGGGARETERERLARQEREDAEYARRLQEQDWD